MHAAISLISLLLIVGTLLPAVARASVLSVILASIKSNTAQADTVAQPSGNVQTMDILKPAMNIDPSPARGGGEITIVDGSALLPEEGPSGTIADIEKPKNATISTYIVQDGDTVSSVAKLFNVSVNTIMWANDLSKTSKLQTGTKLTILPITGVKYTVKKGDTLTSIAAHFNANATEISNYNSINDPMVIGTDILIPDGEAVVAVAPVSAKKVAKILRGFVASGSVIPDAHNPAEPSHNVGPVGSTAEINYYIAPLSHYIQTQGIHGYNAVDLAAPSGTSIMASAGGHVVVAHSGGWNGGYGSYVVIAHANGSETLYGHMSRVDVYDGQSVVQGQVIGAVGSTGDSTGSHLHFEIRNGIRNPF